MDFSEKWGKDVADATKLALADLNLTIEEVDVIVLEEPAKGFFGFGSKMAKVRVQKSTGKPKAASQSNYTKPNTNIASEKQNEVRTFQPKIMESKPVEVKKTEPDEPKSEYQNAERKSGPRQPRPYDKTKREERKPIVVSELEEVFGSDAEKFLKEMTTNMGIDLNIKVYNGEDLVYVNIEGKDSGTIIGKRGQTLDSVQYLAGLVVNKGREKHLRVIVNAENYREKREKTLELLAKRLSDKVIKSGKSVRLEPMNPYERKVIHATLQNHTHVTTRSEGEEPYRRVIIEQK